VRRYGRNRRYRSARGPWLDWAFRKSPTPEARRCSCAAGAQPRSHWAPASAEAPFQGHFTCQSSDFRPDGPQGRGDLPLAWCRGGREARPLQGRAQGDHRRL
jgi:hypothetical protein